MTAALELDDLPLDEQSVSPDKKLRRERERPRPIQLSDDEKQGIVERVKDFVQRAEDDRDEDKQARLQRYAKLMQWAEIKNEPWEGATSVTLPDIIAAALRTEDTLSNAALQTRPMVNAKALDPNQREKQRKLDLLLDTQFFLENPGEKLLEEMAADFVRDGTLTLYVRWVTDYEPIVWLREFDPIELGKVPQEHFRQILDQRFRTSAMRKLDEEGWDWEVIDTDRNKLKVRFYTDKVRQKVLMEVQAEIKTFDGPSLMVVPYEDLLHPYWCSNLQPPSPSNPKGAEWVVYRDNPTLDEIGQLIDSGAYDLIARSDIEGHQPNSYPSRRDEQWLDRQKDALRGFAENNFQTTGDTANQNRTLRYICFDLWTRTGEGKSMNVVWTVLPELDLLARAHPLSEMVPMNPPRRPFAEGSFIPVQNRRNGIGLPELMEGLHDFKTHVFNQMGDACDMEMTPFFSYKPGGNINPQEYQLFPGAGLPVANPGDIEFAKIQPTAASIAINEISLADQMQEKLVSQGSLQFGQVPSGKSSALRTSGGINQILSQGEARPERLLRRFFLVIRDAFALMYQLDRSFLEPKKRFRTIGVSAPGEDPFIEVDAREDLSGMFHFDFEANVLNTSKAALQQSLSEIVQMMLNPLMIQLGIATPDTLYRLLVDYFRALGQTDKYVSPPTPEAAQPKIMAEEALTAIGQGQFPIGLPQEPGEEHLAKIQELLQMEEPGGVKLLDTLEPYHRQILGAYLQSVQQRIQIEQQKQQMMQNAQALQAQRQQQSPGSAPPGQQAAPGMVEQGDVMDESLPASGTPQ